MKAMLLVYVGFMSPADCERLTHSQDIDALGAGQEIVLIRCVEQPVEFPIPVRRPKR